MERALLAASYAGAVASSLAMTPMAVSLARQWGVIDLPGTRKVHGIPTPRLGGIAIAGATLLVSLLVLLAGHFEIDRQMVVVCACALFVLAVGLFDDLLNISSRFKLLALIAAALSVCGVGVRIDFLVIHGYSDIQLNALAWPVTILWIVGITVSINFIDGLDGLAAGISAIACAAVAFTASFTHQFVLAVTALSLLGSLTGFLVFNFNPAKIFMGDCGSMFLGFMLGCLSVMEYNRAGVSVTVGLMIPALALAVPILDTFLTMIRRLVLHRGSLFAAERGHIHHRLLDLGLGQRHSVLILYSASIVSAGVGLLALLDHGWPTLAGLGLLCPLLMGLFHIAGSTRMRETVGAIRRNRAIAREIARYNRAFQNAQLEFRHAADFEAWWRQVCLAAERFDFISVELPMGRRDGSPYVLRWTRADVPDCDVLDAAVPLHQRRRDSELRVFVKVAAPTFLETAGQRVALFARLMGDHDLRSLPQSKRVKMRGPADESAASPAEQLPAESIAAPKLSPIVFSRSVLEKSRQLEPGSPKIRLLPARQDLEGEVGLTATLRGADLVPSTLDSLDKRIDKLRVAVVHDFLYCYAGAERVLEQILKIFPQADVFALFDFLPENQRAFLQGKSVGTTFIQRLPFARRMHRNYLPLMPLAIEQIDVSQYDLVISSSYLAAKGVMTRADQLHICYCHTPVRFAWDLQKQYLEVNGLVSGLKSLLPRMIFHYIRTWDVRSANSVDVFVTNSDYVGRRIQKVYRRNASTVYPPVDTEKFVPGAEREDFYLTASRMVPYKRVELIVEAFNQMPNRRLIVIGDGPEYAKVQAIAGPNVKLVGHQSAEKLRHYMQLARGFVFAAEEDFGIVPVEAQACGTPVIAFGRGGVTESIVNGKTGILFSEQSAASIIDAVERFERAPAWDYAAIRDNAERFSTSRFRGELRNLVQAEWVRFLERRPDLPVAAAVLPPAPINTAPLNVSVAVTVEAASLAPEPVIAKGDMQ